jgi:hypothetical protein
MFTRILGLAVGVWLSIAVPGLASTTGADRLYQCQDGTFTNRPERLCTPYESTGVVMTMPKGHTLKSARALFGETEPTRTLPDPPVVCQLYDEWIALNLRTNGGVEFQLTQDRGRWVALSRIFTAIGTPRCG